MTKLFNRFRRIKTPSDKEQSDPHMVDWLAIIVAFAALSVSMINAWVADRQAGVMERSFVDEKSNRVEGRKGSDAMLAKISAQADASALQARALVEQVKVLSDQADTANRQFGTSEKLLQANRAQMLATRDLARASIAQSQASIRMARTADKQFEELSKTNYENTRATIIISIENKEMNSGNEVNYDFNKQYIVRSSFANIAKSSAIYINMSKVALLNKGGAIGLDNCDSLNCGEIRQQILGGSSVVHHDIIPIFGDDDIAQIRSGKKFIAINVTIVYSDVRFDRVEKTSLCLFLHYKVNAWNMCDINRGIPLALR